MSEAVTQRRWDVPAAALREGALIMSTNKTNEPNELSESDLELASGGGCVYLNFGLFQVVAGIDGGYAGASVCDGSGSNCAGAWVPVK
jgi:hypothetical protein